MRGKKKGLTVFCVCLAAVLAAFGIFGAVGTTAQKRFVIVLDAGHGDPDGGATGIVTGVKESDLNLEICKELKALFEASDLSVVMTRTGKDLLYSGEANIKRGDMKMRQDVILRAQPDLVISIHMNKYSASYRKGAQVFFRKDNEQGIVLAGAIQASMNRSVNERTLSALSGDYFMLNCSDYPSAIVECGFLSNPEEEALLLTKAYREKIAYAVYAGVIAYLSAGIESA